MSDKPVAVEARERIAQDVKMPAGYYVAFGGQFEPYERATRRLYVIVPIVIGSIALLLYFSLGSVRDALIVFTGAPFAAIGRVFGLWARALDFTISAAVGFIAVSGVAMLAGLVLVSTIRHRLAAGASIADAIEESSRVRLRPIVMTALVAALGFVPMALNTGAGAEVQRPLATVVIAGIVTDTILTLLVLPALHALWRGRDVVARAARSKPRPVAQDAVPSSRESASTSAQGPAKELVSAHVRNEG